MAGLLDWFQTPQGIGLLSGVASYAANAQRGRPVNSIGRGLAGGLAGYGLAQDQIRQAEQDKINNELRQFQLQQARDAMARQKAISDKVAGALKPGTPAEAPMQLMGDMPFGMGSQMPEVKPATPPTFFGKPIDPTMAEMLPLMEPEKALQYAMPKAPEYKEVGGTLVAIGPDGVNPVFTAPEKAPSAIQEYQFAVSQGYQGTFKDFKESTARAGATNIVNKIDNKTGESLAGQIGPMAKDSRTRAVGAVKMADAAERLDAALQSGKVIAGPFASKRLFLNQIGAGMGITGPDSVNQTRQVIRSLAESSVEARKELQGQGQVTENEAKAVEKAMSGNIDDMTVPELKALVTLNKKAAKFSAQQHQFVLDQMAQNPSLQGVSGFYAVPGMDRVLQYQFDQPAAQPAVQGGGWSIKKK